MINASEKIEQLLALREADSENYCRFVQGYGMMFCKAWQR